MSLTVIITGLSKKNVLLIQEISLLKKEVEEMKGNGKKIDKIGRNFQMHTYVVLAYKESKYLERVYKICF